MNHKRVERLDREERLAVRRRGRHKRGLSGVMAGSWCPIAANQRWSLAVTEDGLANGRRFRTANLKDDRPRECPAILVDFALPGQRGWSGCLRTSPANAALPTGWSWTTGPSRAARP